MPELPDLEAIQEFLLRELVGSRVSSVEVLQPIPIRRPTPEEFVRQLTGNLLTSVSRRGKFLLLSMESGHVLALNPMLTGRLQYCDARERRRARTCFILAFQGGRQLRYFDAKLMGKVYLVEESRTREIPRWEEMGPEALAPQVTLEVFRQRLRRHPGQIKNILVNDTFLTGIGNAYADEILFAAGVYPFRKRTSLSQEEAEALFRAMRQVLEEATTIVSSRMGDDIHVKIRDFLRVHGKGGQACPRCGGSVSQITANQRLTNYCHTCQPRLP
ncbi:MAG: Fpg/Nei family DNA glycosylase [Chloroflexi bacterium]|nr:Fpg/Nei family DNA glycosylase [Chloroflexota bacterium]